MKMSAFWNSFFHAFVPFYLSGIALWNGATTLQSVRYVYKLLSLCGLITP